MVKMRPQISHDDRFAILDLVSIYGHMLDSGEIEAWIDLFTLDAIYTLPTRSLEGREAIREWIVGLVALRDPSIQTRHHTTNTVLFPEDEDRVLGRSMLFMTAQPRGPASGEAIPLRVAEDERARLTLTGLYGDVFTRTSEGWRFQSRRADVDFAFDPKFAELVRS
ncbi:MAG: nuclear transport factor 2 family protein [bacterium]|nr:nuclear transport factor 2 family protein [bacterium]